MSVSIRREVTFNQGYTVIVFDKDHFYKWPTNIHEHNEIMRLYKHVMVFMKELITTIQIGKNC